MKRQREHAAAKPIEFHRADPGMLTRFDASKKVCTMNCGPHRMDPRSDKERMFLCTDCHEQHMELAA